VLAGGDAQSLYPLGEEAVDLSQLPARMGGLGISSAQRLKQRGGAPVAVVMVEGAFVEVDWVEAERRL
ncbi:hypothetical protein CYMTET_24191, partial [Cymbomonas tetramitiformis]